MNVQRVQGYGVGFQSRQMDRRALATDALLAKLDEVTQKGLLVVAEKIEGTAREVYKIFNESGQVAEYTEVAARA